MKASERVPIVFTVEEHTILGGLGGLITEILSERCPKRVIRFGIEDRWGESAPNEYLLDHFRLSGPRVADRVLEYLSSANASLTLIPNESHPQSPR